MWINPVFQTKEVFSYVEELISSGYTSINELKEDELQHFAGLLVRALGEDGYEFMTAHPFANILLDSVVKALTNPSIKNDEALLFNLRSHAVEYFEDTMQRIFAKVYESYEQNLEQWRKEIAMWGDPDGDYEGDKQHV